MKHRVLNFIIIAKVAFSFRPNATAYSTTFKFIPSQNDPPCNHLECTRHMEWRPIGNMPGKCNAGQIRQGNTNPSRKSKEMRKKTNLAPSHMPHATLPPCHL